MDINTALQTTRQFDYDYVLTDDEVDAVATLTEWVENSVPVYVLKEIRSLALRVKHRTGNIDSLIDYTDKVLREREIEK